MHRLIAFGSRLFNFDTRSILKHFLNFYPMLGRCVGVWVCGCVGVAFGCVWGRHRTKKARIVPPRAIWHVKLARPSKPEVFGCVSMCLGAHEACLGVSGARLGAFSGNLKSTIFSCTSGATQPRSQLLRFATARILGVSARTALASWSHKDVKFMYICTAGVARGM